MSVTKLTRELRRRETEAEKLLWSLIRNRKLEGRKFLRQYAIYYKHILGTPYFFIADFYCAESKLVIELDGGIHEQNKEYDEQRDIIIRKKGLHVLRIKNEELKDINQVLEKIKICFKMK